MEYIFQMFNGLGIVIIIGIASIYFYYRAKKDIENDE